MALRFGGGSDLIGTLLGRDSTAPSGDSMLCGSGPKSYERSRSLSLSKMYCHPNIEMLLPCIDRHLLTYLVSPSTRVNSKEIDPRSYFFVPPWIYLFPVSIVTVLEV